LLELIGSLGGVAILLLGLSVGFGALVLAIKKMYRIVPPNWALIIAGTGKRKGRDEKDEDGRSGVTRKVVTSGGVFVIPFIQKAYEVPLEVMKIDVNVRHVPCSTKIPIDVESTANVRIGNTEEEINMAAMRFLSWGDSQRIENIQEVLAGSLRAIIGKLTPEAMIEDRDEFSSQVQSIASKELQPMGIVIDVLNVKELSDTQGYIDNLGVKQAEEVRKEAEIAKFDADLLITQREQSTELQKSEAIRDTEMKKAQNLAQVEQEQAKASQAGPLAKAEAEKGVVQASTALAKLKAIETEENLVSQVIKPAEAEAKKVKIVADGEREATIVTADASKQKAVLDAQADKESAIERSEGQAKEITAIGIAEAGATEVKGKAEATVGELKARVQGAEIREVALAKAEGMEKEAEALNKLQDAGIEIKKLEIMPDVVTAYALAISNVDNIVVTGTDAMQNFYGMIGNVIQGFMNGGMQATGQKNDDNKGILPGIKFPLLSGGMPDMKATVNLDNAEERFKVAEKLTSALSGITGDTLKAKLSSLRSQYGIIINSLVESEFFDEILQMAEATQAGSLDDQVMAFLDLVNANANIKDKLVRFVPYIETLAPKAKEIVEKRPRRG